MNQENLDEMKSWFEGYAQTFKTGNSDRLRNIVLKEKHTRRVCREILDIGEKLGLGEEDLRLAEVMALFHDIGRFEQYARYGTFQDRISVDHAQLSAEVLQEEGVLEGLDEPTQNLILQVISHHNKKFLPEGDSTRCLFFTRLLRDADKLDILQVLSEYYQNSSEKNKALEYELSDTPGISDEVYREISAGTLVDISHLKNLNDFKMLQIGWVYDINFGPTFRALKERGYLEMIHDTMIRSEKIDNAFARVLIRLEERALERQDQEKPALYTTS